MIVLDIKPLGSGRFAAYVCGKPVVRSSRQPFFDAARALIAGGSPAGATLVMVHPNGAPSLRATLAAAARLSVEDNDYRPPRFRRWQPNLMARGN